MRTPILRLQFVRLGVAAAVAIFAGPILIMLATALDLRAGRPSLDAFSEAFSTVPLASALVNSLWICALGVPAALALASMAAFGLTQLPARLRQGLLLFLLLSSSVPLTAILVPRFILFDAAGLLGTPLPLLAPAALGGTPLACLLLHVALRRIPQDQVDAARLEGLRWTTVWWQVAVPLTLPTHGAVLMLILLGFWSAFLEPLLYLRAERELTAPLMLHAVSLLGSTRWPLLMATAMLITLPVVLVVAAVAPFLRRPFRSH